MAILLLDKTQRYQSSLANYCRTGRYATIPGLNDKNVVQYRRLVFNIIKGSLESAYPLTRELMSDSIWDALLERFFSNYACQSPQIWYMPREFMEYTKLEETDLLISYPILNSLLWFEWLEIEVFMMEDIRIEYRSDGDIKLDKLILNPEIRLERLDYPVHIKKASEISNSDRGEYYFSLHRHPDTGIVRFTDLSSAFVSLLEILREKPVSVTHLIRKLSEKLNISVNKETIELINAFIRDALEKKLIIGFK